MTFCYLHQGTATDWLKQISLAAQPIRSTTQIWVGLGTRHQHRISNKSFLSYFAGKSSGSVAKCMSVVLFFT